MTSHPEVPTDGRGGPTMILTGERKAGSAGRHHAQPDGLWFAKISAEVRSGAVGGVGVNTARRPYLVSGPWPPD